MNIHQTAEYQEVWNCKGYKPLNLEKAKGRILYRFGIPYKTIFGGMCGDGIEKYNQEVICKITRTSKGAIIVYSFSKQQILEKNGFKENNDWTFIVDITNIENLWNKIDKKNRNVIRFAEKECVVFKEIENKAQLNQLYILFKDQANRWDFRIPQKDYFENVWKFLVEKNMAKFFVVSYQNEIVSVAQIFLFDGEMSMPIWVTRKGQKK